MKRRRPKAFARSCFVCLDGSLLNEDVPGWRPGRCIPAYAGSTSVRPVSLTQPEDHPRMRGEHSTSRLRRYPRGLTVSSRTPHRPLVRRDRRQLRTLPHGLVQSAVRADPLLTLHAHPRPGRVLPQLAFTPRTGHRAPPPFAPSGRLIQLPCRHRTRVMLPREPVVPQPTPRHRQPPAPVGLRQREPPAGPPHTRHTSATLAPHPERSRTAYLVSVSPSCPGRYEPGPPRSAKRTLTNKTHQQRTAAISPTAHIRGRRRR